MVKKIFITFTIGMLLGCLCTGIYFIRKSPSGNSTELYQDALTRIGELETIKLGLETNIGKLNEENNKLRNAVGNSISGTTISIGISESIGEDSKTLGGISERIGESITNIDEASKGLADIFGIVTKEN